MAEELILPLLGGNPNDGDGGNDTDETGTDEDDNRIENDVEMESDGEEDEDSEDDQYEDLTSSSTSSDYRDDQENNNNQPSGSVPRHHHHHHAHHSRDHRPVRKMVAYDTTLPAQHSYLGTDLEELHGRVVLDDQSYVNIPLLTLRGVILVPGQILPLQLELPSLIAMLKRIIDKDRTFGLTADLQKASFGTTAEIRSFGEENDEASGLSVLRVKAEGRQRFSIVETWRQPDGILMGKVKILPECDLQNPLRSNCLLSIHGNRISGQTLPVCTPWSRWVYKMYDPYFLMNQINSRLDNWASSGAAASGRIKTTTTRESTGPVTSTTSGTTSVDPSIPDTSNMKVTRTIVTTIRTTRDDESVSEESSSDDDESQFALAPTKPCEFSYWVAKNLPLEDSQRLELLSLNCPIQRLRWELSILQKYLYLCCCECKVKVCHRENVFSMSVHGPQGTYVNPGGYVHETLTVYKAENLALQGRSSTEQSWFPDYAWTICICSNCGDHMGWKFTATNKKLKPESFWGIRRSQIEPMFKNEADDERTKPVI